MALVFIIAVVGVWSIYNFVHLAYVITEITQENYVSVLAAENMVGAIERRDSAELLMLLGEVRGAVAISEIGHSDFLMWLAKEENNITLPDENEVFHRVKESYVEYDRLSAKVRDLMVSGNAERARQAYLAEAAPLFTAIRGDLQRLLEMNHQALLNGNSRSRAAAHRATISTAVVGVSAVLLGVSLGLTVSASVVRPTLILTAAVKGIREGSLDEVVGVGSSDEIGGLALEFNQMVARLREYEEAMTGKVATEQRKALTVITAMDEAAILIDRGRRITMMNPSAAALFGVKFDSVIGKDAFDIIGRSDIASMVAQALSEGSVPHDRTVTMDDGDVQRIYEVEVVPVTTAIGEESVGAVVIFKDVTYFARLEEMKSDFLSDVSHEIRTPLTSITMGIGMLKESEAFARLARENDILAMVDEETRRLVGLVNDLLELSQLESGRVTLHFREVPFGVVIDRAVTPFVPQAQANGICLEVSIDDTLSNVRVDPDKMVSVVTNLLSNAIRYTPSGGKISIKAERRAGELAVSVADTGPGIPIEARERVFDRFYQLKGRPGGAVGLGLPISRAIVRAHGGDIWVEGEEGNGSIFVFTVPLVEAAPKGADLFSSGGSVAASI